MFLIAGVIIRAISVAADGVVLGLTLWKTVYIFKEKKNVRDSSKLTTILAYNGMFLYKAYKLNS